jgi:hypothetical protein
MRGANRRGAAQLQDRQAKLLIPNAMRPRGRGGGLSLYLQRLLGGLFFGPRGTVGCELFDFI